MSERVSEAERLSEDALFLGEKAMYRLSMLALVLYGLSVKRVFLLFCPVELESIRLEFYAMFN